MKTPLLLAALAAILAVSGCIKDPHPPHPEPPGNPGWLIVKWVQLDVYEQFFPDPSGPPNTVRKRESVFTYNQFYKPVLQQIYESPVNDTLNLQLKEVDSIIYDAQRRVKEIRRHYGAGLPLQQVSTFTFNGADTMPASTSGYSIIGGQPGSIHTSRYIYETDEVLVISTDEKTGTTDTTRFIYVNGNYMKYISSQYGEMQEFEEYFSAPNPLLSFNLPHGGVISMPIMHPGVIRLSRNHHGKHVWYEEMVGMPQLNGQGLVERVRYTDPYSIGNKYNIVRYEYDDDVLK